MARLISPGVRPRLLVRAIITCGFGAVLCLGWSGCVTHMLATRIVAAPNRDGLPQMYRDPKILAISDAAYTHSWQIPVGPPDAQLCVGLLEPAEYELKSEIKETSDSANSGKISFDFGWKFRTEDGRAFRAIESPKGTLILLHGFLMSKEAMMPWAVYFAKNGYRVVLVDLRGHGRSTGKWVGFGAWEASDLVQAVDFLQQKGAISGRLGVFGQSYGASIAIDFAARDRRVAAVVALAPFDDPRAVIPEFARGFDPGLAGKISDPTFAKAEEEAARIAGFRWDAVNVRDAVPKARAPILFFHGANDTWVLPKRSEALMAAAPTNSRREVTPHDNHVTLMLRLDLIGPPALAWFDEKLGGPAAEAKKAVAAMK